MKNDTYTTFLRGIAHEINTLATKPEDLKTVLLQGSVAKGIADEYSDIELKLIWKRETSAADRSSVFQQVPKEPLLAEKNEDGEWVSSFKYKSAKVDVSHLEMPVFQSVVESVMESSVTSIASQTLLASIQDSDALHGKDVLLELCSRFAEYPHELSTKCINVNASFTEWSMRHALIKRGDKVALHHLIDMTLLQMLRLLYALNCTYLRSYNFKWFRYHSAMLKVKPDSFEDRVEDLLSTSSAVAIKELDALLNEVLGLVQEHRPDVELSNALKTLAYTRQKLEVDK